MQLVGCGDLDTPLPRKRHETFGKAHFADRRSELCSPFCGHRLFFFCWRFLFQIKRKCRNAESVYHLIIVGREGRSQLSTSRNCYNFISAIADSGQPQGLAPTAGATLKSRNFEIKILCRRQYLRRQGALPNITHITQASTRVSSMLLYTLSKSLSGRGFLPLPSSNVNDGMPSDSIVQSLNPACEASPAFCTSV